MKELVAGLILTGTWAVLQFGTSINSGWIHVLLIAGVMLIIRGIALDRSAT